MPRTAMRAATAGLLMCVLAACVPGPAAEDASAPAETAAPESARPTEAGADAGEGQRAGGQPPRLSSDPEGPALEPDPSPPEPPLPDGVTERPAWLGERPLPERPDGHGEAQPTPEELVDRRLATPDPPDGLEQSHGDAFQAAVEAVPEDVLARSTWHADCPVGVEDLRHVTVSFWGFDERAHPGELLVHRRVADDLVSVFERLHDARFPIEEMRIVDADELDAPPTGDGNNTTAFVCRDVAGASESWSQHAHGLAVDINPFHNPYERGDLVLPELARAYLDRDHHRPGMIHLGDVVTEAFADIGWGWGGQWQTLDDWMHFSESGL